MLNHKMIYKKCGNKSASIDLSQYFTDNLSVEKNVEFSKRDWERLSKNILFGIIKSCQNQKKISYSALLKKNPSNPDVLIHTRLSCRCLPHPNLVAVALCVLDCSDLEMSLTSQQTKSTVNNSKTGTGSQIFFPVVILYILVLNGKI